MDAAWHPDPFHRHELRYWDGTTWSDHVSDRGVVALDPVAPLLAPSVSPYARPVDQQPEPEPEPEPEPDPLAASVRPLLAAGEDLRTVVATPAGALAVTDRRLVVTDDGGHRSLRLAAIDGIDVAGTTVTLHVGGRTMEVELEGAEVVDRLVGELVAGFSG
ncbi:DUF2510 domain-containing protein [Nocardioides sp.]|uniref:DUF2510 domain-containing protein n=1 Tax=Nocardioides sp. TaxID=35761 RepID=UPI0035186958